MTRQMTAARAACRGDAQDAECLGADDHRHKIDDAIAGAKAGGAALMRIANYGARGRFNTTLPGAQRRDLGIQHPGCSIRRHR